MIMLNITPIEIEQVEFKSGFKGYNKEEVKSFLIEIAEEFKILIEENSELRKEIELLKSQLQKYKGIEEKLQNSLIMLQDVERSKMQQAEKEAELIIKQAELDAEKILETTKKKALFLKQDIVSLKDKKISLLRELQLIIKKYDDLLEIELEEEKNSTQVGL